MSALLSVASNKRKKPTANGSVGVASAASTASSNYVEPTANEYITPEDMSFITQEAFTVAIQEEISIAENSNKIDYSQQPKMGNMVTLAYNHWVKIEYRGLPDNKTNVRYAMMKYINEHRREAVVEGGGFEMDLKQFVFHFKSKWKPQKLPVKTLCFVNSHLCIAGIMVDPENRELASKLLSGQKNIDDHDLSIDTVEGGWDHLASLYNDPKHEVPVPFANNPSADSDAALEVPYWEYYAPNTDIGNSIPLLSGGKAMRSIYMETIARPYRTLVDKWTHTETGNGGDKALLSHRFSNNLHWLTYIFVLDKEMAGGKTGGLFLYDRSGVVPADFRIEEGAGEQPDDDGVARILHSGGRSTKRMKDLENALSKSMETCFTMAEERGLFAGDARPRTVNDIVEDLKMTKEQIAAWKDMKKNDVMGDDSNSDDSDCDGMNTFIIIIINNNNII